MSLTSWSLSLFSSLLESNFEIIFELIFELNKSLELSSLIYIYIYELRLTMATLGSIKKSKIKSRLKLDIIEFK